MKHGRSYGLCKKIVAVGKMGKEQMLEKFDVLVLSGGLTEDDYTELVATVYKGNIIKNLIMDCQSYTKYRPNETTGGIFVS